MTMDSLEEYLARKLAALKAHSERMLAQLDVKLDAELRAFVEEKIRQMQANAQKNNEKMIARFQEAMQDLEENKRDEKYPAILLEGTEESIRRLFEISLEGHKKILEAGVANIQSQLKNYTGLVCCHHFISFLPVTSPV